MPRASTVVRAASAPRKRSLAKQANLVPPLWLALFAVLTLGAFSLIPRAAENLRLQASFWGVTACLLIMIVLLRRHLAHAGRVPFYEFKAVTVHWVQPLMQGAIYFYWGTYWPEVFRYAPLIAAQIVFAYALDMIVCWWRRDKWVLGFGPLPIIFSTNLFLWFQDDWFFLQFLMVATGVLGKEFIKWRRDGRLTHIFNPSALSLFIFSIGLIATHSTNLTWGGKIATTMAQPNHMYLEIFLVGLVVQALFSVTLVTLSAAAALFLLGLAYTHATGVYNFVDSNIPVSVFLGLHLLVTDPATSPRRTLGKIVFGGMYGAGVFALFPLLTWLGAPRFYDKLLFVPVLNLSVRALDRLSAAVETRLHWPAFLTWNPRQANLGYMAVWIALFAVMTTTGFLGHSHPGDNPEFWRRACEAGRLHGCREWLNTLKVSCHNGSAAFCLTLGQVEDAGRLVPRDAFDAGRSFGRACDLGLPGGCTALTAFVRAGGKQVFERGCESGDGVTCFVLGWVTDKGMGIPADPARAFALFQRSCARDWARGCGALGECYRQGEGTAVDADKAIENFEKGCRGGHARSCLNAAAMYRGELGGMRDETLARQSLRQACDLGIATACPPGETPPASAGGGSEAGGNAGPESGDH